MSWFSKAIGKVGAGAKKLVTDPGKWAENAGRSVGGAVKAAAPVLNFVPGVGPLAAAGLGALGSVAAGGNMQDHLKTGAIAGGAGLAGKALGAATHIPGVSNVLGAAKSIPGVSTIASGIGKVKDAADAIGSSGLGQAARVLNGGRAITPGNLLEGGVKNVGNAVGGVGNAIQGATGGSGGGGIGGINPLILALAGLQAANAASLGKQSNDYAKNAYGTINDSYASRAGLRDQAIKDLTTPETHDLSGLAAIRNQNPVAARAITSAGLGGPTRSIGVTPPSPIPTLPMGTATPNAPTPIPHLPGGDAIMPGVRPTPIPGAGGGPLTPQTPTPIPSIHNPPPGIKKPTPIPFLPFEGMQ